MTRAGVGLAATLLLTLVACSSLLGIDGVSPWPAPDTDAASQCGNVTDPKALCVTSPPDGATVSGVVSITGIVGSTWVNVAGYDNANGNKVTSDDTPSSGTFTLSLDTTQLRNGVDIVDVVAFSVPANQPDGTDLGVPLHLDVENR